MAHVTKESLAARIAELESGARSLKEDYTLAAYKMLLATMEAEPVAYSLIFRNMDGVLNSTINTNTVFATREKAEAYGKGGNYEKRRDGGLEWVPDTALDPVVIPLYRHAQPAPVAVTDDELNAALQLHRLKVDGHSQLSDSFRAGFRYARRTTPQPAPAVQPVMFIDGDISSEDADKLAKVIREFNEEDERPLAKMARIIRENPHPTNECDMPKAQPAPVVPDDVLDALQKVARIRLDMNDFDGDRRGIADCLGDAEEALIEVVNRRAAMLNHK